jgi:hypothetical protein
LLKNCFKRVSKSTPLFGSDNLQLNMNFDLGV